MGSEVEWRAVLRAAPPLRVTTPRHH